MIAAFGPGDGGKGRAAVIAGSNSHAGHLPGNLAPGRWTTTGSLNISRYGHLAALLPSGQVLVMCGDNTDPSFAFTQSRAELYNPATGTWTLDGNAPSAGTPSQQGFNATLLTTGQVLFSGGTLGVYPAKPRVLANAALFDPAHLNVYRQHDHPAPLPHADAPAERPGAGRRRPDGEQRRVQQHRQRRTRHALTSPVRTRDDMAFLLTPG
jgi:hypothetical protein